MKKFWPYITLLVLLVPSFWNLLKPGYFNMHDDLQVMRIYELEKCFADGQIPCRWVPDMGYGYGQAMFNFYSAFPYYLGEFIRMVTPLSIIWTVKSLFAIAFIGGAFGMYFLAREFWGKWGALTAAVLYTYAPYHSVDIYVRGALSESFALMLLPFLWLAFYKLIQKGGFKYLAFTSITLGLFLSTHNVSSLIYAPFTLIWALFWIIKFKKLSALWNVILSGLLGIGLAAFFILPVALETGLIQSNFFTMDYLDYRGHFVTIYQLFISRHWGYGPSIFGPNDDLSFAIGWPNWWLAIPLIGMGFLWLKNKVKRTNGILILGLLVFAGVATLLTHERSTPAWIHLPVLAIVQFPWRFLGLTIFFLSFAPGALVAVNFKYYRFLAALIIVLSIGLNFMFFRPQYFFTGETDTTKLSGEEFIIEQKSAILDYLPKTAPIAPKEEAFSVPRISSGSGEIKNYSKRSNSFFFDANIFQPAEVRVPVMYFPGWIVINGGKVIPDYPSGNYGVITFTLPKGQYIIQGRFTNTWPRTLGNALTVISAAILLIGAGLSVNKKK